MKKNCPYCNTVSGLYFRSRDYNHRITETRFDHYRCPACGLIFIAPIPANLGEYYPPAYYRNLETQDSTQTLDFLEANTGHEQYKVEIIRRFRKDGRLLEIGPAAGGFAYRAKKAGFETQAIEMDAGCSAFLNEVAGIPTVNNADTCAALETLPSFDIIALWHVIEHLPDPFTTLDAVCRKLNPGGILVLAAPNPDAFQFHILGRYWPHVDAPRHLMLIPVPLLITKMAKLGMTAELVTTRDEGSIACNIFGWVYFFSSLCRQPRINALLQRIGHRTAWLFSAIEKTEGKGSAYTIVFRKGT